MSGRGASVSSGLLLHVLYQRERSVIDGQGDNYSVARQDICTLVYHDADIYADRCPIDVSIEGPYHL